MPKLKLKDMEEQKALAELQLILKRLYVERKKVNESIEILVTAIELIEKIN
mgnify:FL=1